MDFNIAHVHQAMAAAGPHPEALVWRDDASGGASGLNVFDAWPTCSLIGESAPRVTRRRPRRGSRSRTTSASMWNAPEYVEAVLGAHVARAAPFTSTSAT